MIPAGAGRLLLRGRPERRTRRSSGRWPCAGPRTWPVPAARTTPGRPAPVPGSPTPRSPRPGSASRRGKAATPRGSCTRERTRRQRRPRRTPGRRARSPRRGWRRTPPWSAPTPTSRRTGSASAGAWPQAVPRSPSQPKSLAHAHRQPGRWPTRCGTSRIPASLRQRNRAQPAGSIGITRADVRPHWPSRPRRCDTVAVLYVTMSSSRSGGGLAREARGARGAWGVRYGNQHGQKRLMRASGLDTR